MRIIIKIVRESW